MPVALRASSTHWIIELGVPGLVDLDRIEAKADQEIGGLSASTMTPSAAMPLITHEVRAGLVDDAFHFRRDRTGAAIVHPAPPA